MRRRVPSSAIRKLLLLDPLRDVVRALARAKLDDAKIGEPALVERIFTDDRFDLLSVPAHRQNDSTIPRALPARDQGIAGSVTFMQSSDVRRHTVVDFA